MKKIIIDHDATQHALEAKINHETGFGKSLSPILIECDYADGKWGDIYLNPYHSIQLDPACKVLHYGQEIFEGLKAYKNDQNEIFLFRPNLNANRFNRSALRMCMPEFPIEDFINAVTTLTYYSRNLIPKRIGESLYLRPFMFATEVALGIKPSDSYKFMLIASPVANYFTKASVKVLIEREASRAAPGGTGSAKTGGNYAASLQSYDKIAKLNCDQTMWLDAVNKQYIEEMSGMNFFAVINDELYTPALTDTILEGITRDSIVQLAAKLELRVHEGKLKIDELLDQIESGQCTEAFVCGTASVITPINSLLDSSDNKIYHLKHPTGKISLKIKDKLLAIQSGREIGPDGWQVRVEMN
jgi:branched-chain amino acid aminotransferase